MADDEVVEPTLKEKCLFYTTAFFILLSIFSLFSFLFLVPFVIDPAFTTISLEFDASPALCMTVSIESRRGSKNCSWTSCREGCTKDIFECTQIVVNYLVNKQSWEEGQGAMPPPPELPPDFDPDNVESIEWDYSGARVFPNSKGCGYPPILNCTLFLGMYAVLGTTYPCFYSRVDPGFAVTEYSMWQVTLDLVYSMAIPIPSFFISVIYLVVAYFKIYADEPPVATAIPTDGGDAAGEEGSQDGGDNSLKDSEGNLVKFADCPEQNGPSSVPKANSTTTGENDDANEEATKYLQPGYLPEKGGKEKLPPIHDNENIRFVEVQEAGLEKSREE